MVPDRPPVPLPSHVHYELLLQLLERQTAEGVRQDPLQKEQLQALIGTLRKAFSQQKQLEESCVRSRIPIEYHWSLNEGQNGAYNNKKCISNETSA